ncbi:MAG: hypothetical protein ACI4KA_04305 [Oscillospiraceae bacterium]
MTNTSDMQKSGLRGLDTKVIGIALAVYSLVEAIFAYLFFFKPLYIDPVYLKCDEYNADGITCLVKLFGKTLASPSEVSNNQVILSLWDTISNIILIYLLITVAGILLAFCIYKGMSFAKTYFVAFFGAKHIIGMMAVLVPMANMRRSTMYFGIVDALLSVAVCIYFVTLTNDEYADDMLFTDEQIAAMNKRMKTGFILYGGMLLYAFFEKYSMSALGKNKSLFLNWQEKSTAFTQGLVITGLLAVALIAAIVYIKDADWALFFFSAFGTAAALSNIFALVGRIGWATGTYPYFKNLYESGDKSNPDLWANAELLMTTSGGISASWIASVICLAVATVAALAVAFLAVIKLLPKFKVKIAPTDKKPALAVLISSGSIILSFVFTVIALGAFVGQRDAGTSFGAMDYLYFTVYGGLSLFLALAMMGGYSFTKFGTLGLFLVTMACNFGAIFTVLDHKKAMIENGFAVAPAPYMMSVVFFVLSIVSCFGLIASFAVKGVDDYMYQKRFC